MHENTRRKNSDRINSSNGRFFGSLDKFTILFFKKNDNRHNARLLFV